MSPGDGIRCTVVKMGSAAKSITLPSGTTVSGALEVADYLDDFENGGLSLALNGVGANLDAEVPDGAQITLGGKVTAG
jgi:hypothetical protein